MPVMDEFKEERANIKNQPLKKDFSIFGLTTNGMC